MMMPFVDQVTQRKFEVAVSSAPKKIAKIQFGKGCLQFLSVCRSNVTRRGFVVLVGSHWELCHSRRNSMQDNIYHQMIYFI